MSKNLQSLQARLANLVEANHVLDDPADAETYAWSVSTAKRELTRLAMKVEDASGFIDSIEQLVGGSLPAVEESDEPYASLLNRHRREEDLERAIEEVWYRAGQLRNFRPSERADRLDSLILELEQAALRSSSAASESASNPILSSAPSVGLCSQRESSSVGSLSSFLPPVRLFGAATFVGSIAAVLAIRHWRHSSHLTGPLPEKGGEPVQKSAVDSS